MTATHSMPELSLPDKTYTKSEILSLPNNTSNAGFMADLREKGFCVVPSIVPRERCDEYIQEAYEWLEGFGLGFKRDDRTTWRKECLPVHNVGGLYNRYACSHENWARAWRIRCEPAVIKAFAELWGTEELIVSFDAVNVTFPYGEHGRTDIDWVNPWPHQDQDPRLPIFQLAQGIFTCSESGPDDGGLCVMAGSHLKHQEFFDAKGGIDETRLKRAQNSYHYRAEEAQWYKDNGCYEVKVEAPAGSLIMWDSRLMHWNRLPTGDRVRVAGYVCYQPRSQATPEQLKRKAEVFENRQVATHWPANNDVRELYQGGPQRDGKLDPANRSRPGKEPVITDTLLKLAGVKAY